MCDFVKKGPAPKQGGWHCVHCDCVFRTRAKLYKHVQNNHNRYDENGKRLPWNRGLTKETNESIAKQAKTYTERYKEGKIKVWCDGKHIDEVTRQKISESMKIAHQDGRAHNIGESRWNNEPSYPEKWFMEVIKNEFDDKNYIREYSFGRFSLDFAWPHKKKCIEIDGQQHERFDDIKARDEAKNKLLTEKGWEYIRLSWRAVYAKPKAFIYVANKFIGN